MEQKNTSLPEEIKVILQKYYNGESSIDEDRELKNFFEQNGNSIQNISDQRLFKFLNNESYELIPNEIIWNRIRKDDRKKRKLTYTYRVIASLAASIVIIFSISLWFNITKTESNNLLADSYSNPKEAYKVAQKYLGIASSSLSIAYDEIKPIEKLTVPSEMIVSFENLDKSIIQMDQLKILSKSATRVEKFSVFTDYLKLNDNFQPLK